MRQENEAAAAHRPQRPKVPLVERHHAVRLEAMGQHRDGEVSQTDVKVRIPVVVVEQKSIFSRLEANNSEAAGGQIR